MKVWLCDCGCEIRDIKPKECPLCKKKHFFSETDFPDPSREDQKYSKLYNESLKQLEEYEKGCPVKHLDPCAEDC